jgi:hypothetical protein
VAEKSSAGKACRIPPEAGGIQVNFCKNPSCANDGVPARLSIRRGGTGGGKVQDGYAPTLSRCHFSPPDSPQSSANSEPGQCIVI